MPNAQHTNERFYITLGYVAPLFDTVRAHGKPLDPLLELLGIGVEDLGRSDLRLSDRLMSEAYVLAERLCRDANIGLHAGQRMWLSNIGLLGHLIMTCTKFSQVISLHTRFQILVGNGALSDYDVGVREVCLSWRRSEGAPPYPRHFHEFNLAGWVSLIKIIAGQQLRPNLVEFPCAPPVDDREQRALFGCELKYGAGDCMRVHFDRDHLERAMVAGDSTLRSPLEAAARKQLEDIQGTYGEESGYLPGCVRNLVRRELLHGPPGVEQVAKSLGVSVRTLQRQLDAHGVTYKALVDEARQLLAERYIVNADLTLIDIALMLGFSNQSSFQRAFKRWMGLTPGEYRRRHGI